MFEPLWHTFCIFIIAYCRYKALIVVFGVAAVIFAGGSVFLTLFAYICVKLSMPRSRLDFLPEDAGKYLKGSEKR